MVQKNAKRSIITAGIALIIVLLIVGGIVFVGSLNDKKDPYRQQQTETSTTEPSEQTDLKQENQDALSSQSTARDDTQSSDTTVDPASVSTIDVPPMAITVSYVKGAGSFEYQVQRAANGTRYVEFRSPSLVGTKCTNDMGTFASVLANPTADESATVAKTTKVGETTYGLSLAGTTCTSDVALLQKYQKSFSDAFSLLKPLE